MKRITLAMLLVLCLSCSAVPIWGSETTIQQEVEIEGVHPYVYASKINAFLEINQGTVTCSVDVPMQSLKSIDYAQVTAIIKKGSGTAVKTFNQRVYPNAFGKVGWSGSYKLTAKGSYYLAVTVKLYKSGKVVETLTKSTQKKIY